VYAYYKKKYNEKFLFSISDSITECFSAAKITRSRCLPHSSSVLPDWVVLNLIVRVNIGFSGWKKFGLVWGQFGGFQTYKLYRLIG